MQVVKRQVVERAVLRVLEKAVFLGGIAEDGAELIHVDPPKVRELSESGTGQQVAAGQQREGVEFFHHGVFADKQRLQSTPRDMPRFARETGSIENVRL